MIYEVLCLQCENDPCEHDVCSIFGHGRPITSIWELLERAGGSECCIAWERANVVVPPEAKYVCAVVGYEKIRLDFTRRGYSSRSLLGWTWDRY